MSQFSRSEALLGELSTKRFAQKNVLIFGVGGVGGYVAEILARGGIGSFTLVDCDTVSESNLNRQIIALHSTLGQKKTAVMRQRIVDINPKANVTCTDCFVSDQTISRFDFSTFDFVVDAIDTVCAKIAIIERCVANKVPVISAMGAGNKLDPFRIQISDISKTSVCPLARAVRYELRKRGITKGVWTAFSTEEPATPKMSLGSQDGRKSIPGSLPYLPSVMGIMIASHVLKLLNADERGGDHRVEDRV